MGKVESSLAPQKVVLSLYNTDGEKVPGQGHLAHSDYGVLLRVKLQDVIAIVTIIATCSINKCGVLGVGTRKKEFLANTENKHTVFNGHSLQSIDWLRQFGSGGPCSHQRVKCLR